MTRHYSDLGSVSDWFKNFFIRSEKLPRSWYVIGMEFLHSCPWKTSGREMPVLKNSQLERGTSWDLLEVPILVGSVDSVRLTVLSRTVRQLVQAAVSKAGKTTLRGFPLIQTVSSVFQESPNLE